MKKILPLIALGVLFLSAKKSIDPPGTVQIGENLWMDKTEIKNLDYREYLFYLSNFFGKESETYKEALPDTLIWTIMEKNCASYSNYYFGHPAYSEYPVVGVTHEQVLNFCKWRSESVNRYYYLKSTGKKPEELKTDDIIPQLYTYRLPTKEEWMNMAKYGLSERQQKKIRKKFAKGPTMMDNNEWIYGNFNIPISDSERNSLANPLGDHADILAPVKSYYPNEYGIFNLHGNVAEMVAEDHIAFGGHWMESIEDYKIEKEYPYNGPQVWLGFRCVAVKN